MVILAPIMFLQLSYISHVHLYVLSIIFLYFNSHHMELHSFPTRRSSDLARFDCFPDPKLMLSISKPLPLNMPIIRSEEHTSELQSRGHLVCRLLLEKKKKKTMKKKI